jgi:hypothetical protein
MAGVSKCRWNGAPVGSLPAETSLCFIGSDPDTGIPIAIPKGFIYKTNKKAGPITGTGLF